MRVCGYQGCPVDITHLSVLAKSCLDCAQTIRRDRKNARQRGLRAAHRASMTGSRPVRICQYPGCTNDISQRTAKAVWCVGCRRTMDKSRAARRYGLEGRAAVDPFERRVVHVAGGAGDQHKPIKCLQCCDMPWARRKDRSNSRSGDSAQKGPSVVDERGLCRGCGLPWAPEPRPELCGTIRSSAALAAEHGSLYGGQNLSMGNGQRKGVKR